MGRNKSKSKARAKGQATKRRRKERRAGSQPASNSTIHASHSTATPEPAARSRGGIFRGIFRFFRFAKRHAFIVTIVAGLFTTAIAAYKFHHWEPAPKVGLAFDGSVPVWMRPDFGMSRDLAMMGFKDTKSKVMAMSMTDMLTGTLRNEGNRDARSVEIKVPCDGNLRFLKVAGLPKNPTWITKPSDTRVVPDQYVPLGDLRADDPPFLIVLFSSMGQLTSIKFRYIEGDATETVSYLVKRDPVTYQTRIVREVWRGMDEDEFRAFKEKVWGWGWVVLATITVVGAVLWFARKRIPSLLKSLWAMVATLWRHTASEEPAQTDTLLAAPAAQTTRRLDAAQNTKQETPAP